MEASELDTLKLALAHLNLYLATLQQALLNKGILTQAEIDAAQKQVGDQAREEGAKILLASLPKPPGAVQ
jgi:hypothetical protein